ncbi:hypothetical protein vseg_007385 [Gypsophila vaccaria]
MPNSAGNTVSNMSFTDPLYYNPSEGTHTLKDTLVITGIENYGPWKRQMELALSA